MELTSHNVEELFHNCLSEQGIFLKGTIVEAKIDISGHEGDIISLLLQLPEEFFESKGKGSSFHNANITKFNKEWTTTPVIVEKLLLLGIATKQVKRLPSANMWRSLPGEPPYFVILDKEPHNK